MESKFSLVIGSYNPNKEWLKEALKSAEGLFDEIILVDDGSDEPIEGATIRQVNSGCYVARNTGINLASGDIICSLDDDDLFIEDNVIGLKKLITDSNDNTDIWHFPIILFGNQAGLAMQAPDMKEILNSNQIPSGSWFKKEVWDKLNGFQYPLAEDWDFWARAYKKGMNFKYYNNPIYRYRVRSDSRSAGWVGDKFIEIREEIRLRYTLCK